MSQLPSVQLQMPGLTDTPEIPYLYQENKVILPEPKYAVSMSGLDFEALAPVIGNFGVSVYEGYRETKAQAKIDALQALQLKAKKSIQDYAEINDFENVEKVRTEYTKATEELIGYNPFDPTFVPQSTVDSKLTNYARSFEADILDFSEGKKKGFQDIIAIEGFEQLVEADNRKLIESDDPITSIDKILEERKTLYGTLSNGSILGERLPDTGFTASQRNLLYKINKDYTDLLEQREKLVLAKEKQQLGQAKDYSEELDTRVQNQFIIASSYLEQATKLAKQSEELDRTSDEAKSLRARSQQLGTQGMKFRQMAMETLAREKTNEEFSQTFGPFDDRYPFEIPELSDPNSIEAMTYLINSGTLSNETTRAMGSAFDNENTLLATTSTESLRVQQKLKEEQKSAVKERLKVHVSDYEAKLTLLESRQKEIKDGPIGGTAAGKAQIETLETQKTAILGQLRDSLLKDLILPLVPKNTAKTPSIHSFLKKQEEKRFSTRDDFDELQRLLETPSSFNLDFSKESFAVLQGTYFGIDQNVVDIYGEAIREVNRIDSKFSDIISGNSTTYDDRLKKQKDKAKNIGNFWANLPPEGRSFSSSEIVEYSILTAMARLESSGLNETLFTKDGNLPSLDEALRIIRENKDNQQFLGNRIPLSPAMIQSTSWFPQILEKVMKESESPEQAVQMFDQTMNELVGRNDSNLAWHDITQMGHSFYPIPSDSPSIDQLVTLVRDTRVPQELTATAFLSMSSDSRKTILGKLRENTSTDPALQDRVDYLDYISGVYPETGSPGEFVLSLRRASITPFIIDRAKAFTSAASKYDPQTPVSKSETDQQEIKRQEVKNFMDLMISGSNSVLDKAMELIQFTYPEVITDQNKAGLRNILGNPNDDFMKTLILYATAEAWDETSKTFNWNKDNLAQAVVERLKTQWLPKRKFDKDQNKFVIGLAEQRKAGVTRDTDTYISDSITSASGHDFGPRHRSFIVGSSTQQPYKANASETEIGLILGQVAPQAHINQQSYSLLSENPINGLVYLGVLSNKRVTRRQLEQLVGSPESEVSTSSILNDLVIAATTGLPQNNYTVMAAMAAIAELDPNETQNEKAKTFVSNQARVIYSAIESGESRTYKTRVVERNVNNNLGSRTATIQIIKKIQDKDIVLAEFQPNTKSVSSFMPTVESAVDNPTLSKLIGRIDYAGVAEVLKDKNIPQRSKDSVAVSFAMNNENIDKWARVGLRITNPTVKSLILADVSETDYDLTFLPVPFPINKNTTFSAYWKEEIPYGTFVVKKGNWIKNSSGTYTIDRSSESIIYTTRPFGNEKANLRGMGIEPTSGTFPRR